MNQRMIGWVTDQPTCNDCGQGLNQGGWFYEEKWLCSRCHWMRTSKIVVPDEPDTEEERQQVLADVSAEVLGRISPESARWVRVSNPGNMPSGGVT